MADDTLQSGPYSLYQKVEGLSGPLRYDALVTCTYCREGHAGYCPNDLVSDGDACPVGWLTDEIDRREMESPSDS